MNHFLRDLRCLFGHDARVKTDQTTKMLKLVCKRCGGNLKPNPIYFSCVDFDTFVQAMKIKRFED